MPMMVMIFSACWGGSSGVRSTSCKALRISSATPATGDGTAENHRAPAFELLTKAGHGFGANASTGASCLRLCHTVQPIQPATARTAPIAMIVENDRCRCAHAVRQLRRAHGCNRCRCCHRACRRWHGDAALARSNG